MMRSRRWWLYLGLTAVPLLLVLPGCLLDFNPGDALPPPSIIEFRASSEVITAGTVATLTPRFELGDGTVDRGVGIVSSGTPVQVSPAADTTYALTVTNAEGVSVVSTATIRVVPPAHISGFAAVPAVVDEGGSSVLTALYENGAGTVDNSLGALPSGLGGLVTKPLTATTQFTLTVTNAAGDSVRAAVVVTVRRIPEILVTGSMVQPRYRHTATRLLDGRVLMVGGFAGDEGGWATTAELYDPASGTSTPTGAPLHPRVSHTATLLPNGEVLVAGGEGSQQANFTAELYNPAIGNFRFTGALNVRRSYAAAALLDSGKVLVAGGVDTKTNRIHASAEIYDPATGQFSATTGPMSAVRLGHTALRVPGGKVVIAGGHVGAGQAKLFEQFDPDSGTFRAAGAPLIERSVESWSVLANGELLVAGGTTAPGPLGFVDSAEIYDPVGGFCRFVPGVLSSARAWHTSTLLGDGTVLIAGGASERVLNTLEVFDPSTEAFKLSPTAMQFGRYWHTATLLTDGRVLISGGKRETAMVAVQELYVP